MGKLKRVVFLYSIGCEHLCDVCNVNKGDDNKGDVSGDVNKVNVCNVSGNGNVIEVGKNVVDVRNVNNVNKNNVNGNMNNIVDHIKDINKESNINKDNNINFNKDNNINFNKESKRNNKLQNKRNLKIKSSTKRGNINLSDGRSENITREVSENREIDYNNVVGDNVMDNIREGDNNVVGDNVVDNIRVVDNREDGEISGTSNNNINTNKSNNITNGTNNNNININNTNNNTNNNTHNNTNTNNTLYNNTNNIITPLDNTPSKHKINISTKQLKICKSVDLLAWDDEHLFLSSTTTLYKFKFHEFIDIRTTPILSKL
ncbi:hypothetical protein NAPIS_ORF00118, partial [Vairimorpha apis BRL 01]